MIITASSIYNAINDKLGAMMVEPDAASDEQLYKASAAVLRDICERRRKAFVAQYHSADKKQVYYLSMEFLMGRSFRNSLYNLGLLGQFTEALARYNTSPDALYRYEPDPGLGNGGLGRLAACYLDGLATDGYLATGYCILYEYGIFKQKLDDGWQKELPDYWLPGGEIWLQRIPEHTVEVRFGGQIEESWDGPHHMMKHTGYTTVYAVPYNMYVTGYDTKAVSLLRLWKAQAPGLDMELFNSGDYMGAVGKNSYAESISKILYPNDNHREGMLLRLRQQYFLAAAAVADIFRRHMSVYGTVENLAEKNAIHINDTHPTLAIAELMRILLDECGYEWEQSWDIVAHTFAYTNHTVMSEALEVWQADTIRELLPRIWQIICEIDRRFVAGQREKGASEADIADMCVIYDGQVRMANLCVIGSHHVNGVSAMHSQIIRESVFAAHYRATPAKFTNVTNGIASRRWLMQANPRLTEYISNLIGDGFLKDMQRLSDLKKYIGSAEALDALAQVKRANKETFAAGLLAKRGITVDPDSLFFVQVKRMHEYKRQLLNAMQVLSHYLDIRQSPDADFPPRTYFFGAKAASGYYLAKQVIKFICDLGQMIDADPAVRGRLRIVFLEEYNVSLSEALMPASEVSQQISLAGTEASGTGNMKLMLSGAVTLGTLDGANVEIAEAVGEDNILICGMSTAQAHDLAARGYNPADYLSGRTAELLAFLREQGERNACFGAMADYLEHSDRYMALADFGSYAAAEERAAQIYFSDSRRWQAMSLRNIAESGRFCADRAIHDYARDIWGL